MRLYPEPNRVDIQILFLLRSLEESSQFSKSHKITVFLTKFLAYTYSRPIHELLHNTAVNVPPVLLQQNIIAQQRRTRLGFHETSGVGILTASKTFHVSMPVKV